MSMMWVTNCKAVSSLAPMGAPLAVASQNRVMAKDVWRCRETGIGPDEQTHLDELSERMNWLELQPWGKRRVPVVDREGDSAVHRRQWSEHGQHGRVRVKAVSSVCFDGQSMRIREGKWRNG